MAKKRNRGASAFDQYYRNFFGERWDSLKKSLLGKKSYVAFMNPYFTEADQKSMGESFLGIESCRIKSRTWEAPPEDNRGILQYYLMDAASVLAPVVLNVKKGERVLDMCAAPGGKSLVLAYNIGINGELIANDRSRNRRNRLQKVLNQYLPESIRNRVKVTGHDASRWCLHEKNAYDKILLDAPCSSERHVLTSPEHLKEWGPGRSKHLSLTQFSMLASALDALKVGGSLVYSTCALSFLENDGVVGKLFKKRKGHVELNPMSLAIGEKTSFGHMILPDDGGWGPFYLSSIKKLG